MRRGRWTGVLVGVLASVVGVACGAFSSSGDSPSTTQPTDGATPDVDDAGALAPDAPSGPPKKIFVIGGQTDTGSSNRTFIGRVEPTGIAWSEGAPLPETRQGACAINVDDRLVVLGGTGPTAGSLLGAVSMRLDDATPSWVGEIGPATPRQGAGCAAGTGHLYVAGGGDAFSSSQRTTAEMGTVGADGGLSWSNAPALPSGVQDLPSLALLGHVYLFGGYPCRSNVLSAAVNADGSLGGWQDAGALQDTRYGAAAAATNDAVYVLGGLGETSCSKGSAAVDRIVVDAEGLVTAVTGERVLPQARNYPGAAVIDGRLYVLGGNIGGGTPTPTDSVVSAEIHADGSLGDWKDETRLPRALARFALVVR